MRGSGWQVFGVIVVLFWFSHHPRALQAIIGGISDESFVGYALADLISNVLFVPLTALAATVVYVELRRVKGEPLPEAGAPPPLPPQQGAPPATQVHDGPPEPSDAPPQAGPEAPPSTGPEAPPR